MHQRPGAETEQWLVAAVGLGLAVAAVLLDGVVDALGEVGLELDGRDGDAVDEQHHVDAAVVGGGEVHLPDDAETVAGIVRDRRLVAA